MATVRYIVNDVEAAVAFYTKGLGFELQQQFGPAMAIMKRGDLTLWVAGPQASASRPMPDGRKPEPGGWGRFVLEVVPPIDASKGTAVRALLAETGLRRGLYAGDDVTDLDGFRALDGLDVAVRIAIASSEGPSELGDLADVVVGSTGAFVEILKRL